MAYLGLRSTHITRRTMSDWWLSLQRGTHLFNILSLIGLSLITVREGAKNNFGELPQATSGQLTALKYCKQLPQICVFAYPSQKFPCIPDSQKIAAGCVPSNGVHRSTIRNSNQRRQRGLIANYTCFISYLSLLLILISYLCLQYLISSLTSLITRPYGTVLNCAARHVFWDTGLSIRCSLWQLACALLLCWPVL